MTLIFFALSVLGCLLTWNVYRPNYGKAAPAAVSFISGWWYGDLAPWIIIVQVTSTAALALFGFINGPLGAVGLMLAVGSWIALAVRYGRAMEFKSLCENALEETLGIDFAAVIPEAYHQSIPERFPLKRYLLPFRPRLPNVSRVRNITVATENDWDVNIDIYHRKDKPAGAPVLFQIHGGAWTENFGDKSTQALPLMNHLASQGWVCVSVDYRLSPTHVWPAHIVDCKRALAWIKDNIQQYGGNADFVVATGGSAGGHLCSLLGLTANDPEFQPGFESVDTNVRGCVPFYGVYDLTDAFDLHINDGLLQILQASIVGKPLEGNEELYRRASPIHRIHSDAPPFFVVHGSHDSLISVPEAMRFVEQLRATSQQPVAFLKVPGAQHAFDLFATPRADWAMRSVILYVNYLHALYAEDNAGRQTAKTID